MFKVGPTSVSRMSSILQPTCVIRQSSFDLSALATFPSGSHHQIPRPTSRPFASTCLRRALLISRTSRCPPESTTATANAPRSQGYYVRERVRQGTHGDETFEEDVQVLIASQQSFLHVDKKRLVDLSLARHELRDLKARFKHDLSLLLEVEMKQLEVSKLQQPLKPWTMPSPSPPPSPRTRMVTTNGCPQSSRTTRPHNKLSRRRFAGLNVLSTRWQTRDRLPGTLTGRHNGRRARRWCLACQRIAPDTPGRLAGCGVTSEDTRSSTANFSLQQTPPSSVLSPIDTCAMHTTEAANIAAAP